MASPPSDETRRANLLKARSEKMHRDPKDRERSRAEDMQELIHVLTEAGGGSLLRGWRRELDQYGNLAVDFPDFCKAADRLYYSGDAYLLFGADGDFSALNMVEVAPREGELMERFKHWVRGEFNTPAEFFERIEHESKGKGRITKEGFMSSLSQYGFACEPSEVSEIWDCTDSAMAGSILPEDLIYLEVDPKVREDVLFRWKTTQMREWKVQIAEEYIKSSKATGKSKDDAKASKGRHAPRPWQADHFDGMPQVVCHKRHMERIDAHWKGQQAKELFLNHIRKFIGNEVRAMRSCLDKNGDYNFSQMELRGFCRRQDINVQIRDLWTVLKKDDDAAVSLEELCIERAVALARFRRWCMTNRDLASPSCVAVWDHDEAIHTRKVQEAKGWPSDKKMQIAPFSRTLKALGWPEATNKKQCSLVMTSLDYMGCGVLERTDLEWLDKWKAPEWLYVEPDEGEWSRFKDLLVEKFKHPLRAWRMVLDLDSSNKISWTEFLSAAKKVRYEGCVGAAWRALDTDLSGVITMREYDPPSAELLESFKEWADSNFGSVKLCYQSLDDDHSGSVTFPEFKRACHKLKWGGDVKMLFDCLEIDAHSKIGGEDAATGKRALTLNELDFLDKWQVEPSKEELQRAVDEDNEEREAARRAEKARRLEEKRSSDIKLKNEERRKALAAKSKPKRSGSKPTNPIDGSGQMDSMALTSSDGAGFYRNPVLASAGKSLSMFSSASAPNLMGQTIAGGEVSRLFREPHRSPGQQPLGRTFVWQHWRGMPIKVERHFRAPV